MKIRQIRNATLFLELGAHKFIVDPMLAAPGQLPGFKLWGPGRQRNPLVPLPPEAQECLDQATGVIVTHEHPDHFDKAAVRWIRERNLDIWASPIDAPNLIRKGLTVHELTPESLGFPAEVVSVRHGPGLIGWLMGPVGGLFLAHKDEPSLFLTSDAVLTEDLLKAIDRLQPDVIVAPAGSANFGFGPNILFSIDELITLCQRAPRKVVLNHLEALDHCPTTRVELKQRLEKEALLERVFVPDDGECLEFAKGQERSHAIQAFQGRGGLQKWLTASFAGT